MDMRNSGNGAVPRDKKIPVGYERKVAGRGFSAVSGEQRAEMDAFEKRLKTMKTGRKLFTTFRVFLGLGPRSTRMEKGYLY